MIRSIRTAFITGLVIILPLGVTGLVMGIILDKVGNPASELFFRFIDSNIRDLPTGHSASGSFFIDRTDHYHPLGLWLENFHRTIFIQ